MKTRAMILPMVFSLALTAACQAEDWVVFHGAEAGQAVRTRLKAGDEIKTNSSSQADIVLQGQVLLRLGRNSDLRIKALSGTPEGALVELRDGKVMVQVSTGSVVPGQIQLSSARVAWPSAQGLVAVLNRPAGRSAVVAVGQGEADVKGVRLHTGEQLEIGLSKAATAETMSETQRSDVMRWAAETNMAETLQRDSEIPEKTPTVQGAPEENAEDRTTDDASHDSPGTRGESFPRNAEPLRP